MRLASHLINMYARELESVRGFRSELLLLTGATTLSLDGVVMWNGSMSYLSENDSIMQQDTRSMDHGASESDRVRCIANWIDIPLSFAIGKQIEIF